MDVQLVTVCFRLAYGKAAKSHGFYDDTTKHQVATFYVGVYAGTSYQNVQPVAKQVTSSSNWRC